jgi:transposase
VPYVRTVKTASGATAVQMVSAFEGNKAETKTVLPVIGASMAAHNLPDVTVVADAGMVSEANQKEIEAAGLSFTSACGSPRCRM